MHQFTQEFQESLTLERGTFQQTSQRVREIVSRVPSRTAEALPYGPHVIRNVGLITLGSLADGTRVTLSLEEMIGGYTKWDGDEIRRRGPSSMLAERFCPKDTRYSDGGVHNSVGGVVRVLQNTRLDSETSAVMAGRLHLVLPRVIESPQGDFIQTGLSDTLVRSPRLGVGRYLESPSDAQTYIDGIVSLAEAAVGIPKPAGSVPEIEFALGEQFLGAEAPDLVPIYR